MNPSTPAASIFQSRENRTPIVPHMRVIPAARLSDRWSRVLACCFLLATCLATAGAEEGGDAGNGEADSADVNLAQEVPVWVAQLDGSTAQSRREAEQKLLAAGPAAADFVPVILDHLSLDARERMQRIEAQWRQMTTREEVETTTVKMQNARTLGEALGAISLASGVEFDLQAGGAAIDVNRPVRPPAAPMGFWQAVDLVLDQTDLDINFYGGDRERLALVPRSPDRASRLDSAAYAGIYRLEPTIVTARRVLGSPSQNSLNLTISISWQPNRTPIGLSIPINDLIGKLDNDVELRPQSSGEQIDISTSGEIAESQFYLPLQLPRRRFELAGEEDENGQTNADPTEIKRLSARITALLPGKRRTFELPLADVAPSKTLDAMTVAVEAIRQTDPLHEIRVGVELFGAGRALESHRQWIYENEVYVLLPDGTRKDHLGYEVYRQTESGVGIGYLFDLGGSIPTEAKLVYESPTSVQRNEVPFLLNGIPLP